MKWKATIKECRGRINGRHDTRAADESETPRFSRPFSRRCLPSAQGDWLDLVRKGVIYMAR